MIEVRKLLILFICLASFLSRGNNLSVELKNVTQINTYQYEVSCSISWDNSWNESLNTINHDASWVFVKQRALENSSTWLPSKIIHVSSSDFHFNLSNDSLALVLTSNCALDLHQSAGEVIFTIETQLTGFELFVAGIELVYVPEGAFFAGDKASIHRFENSLSEPVLITSEDQLLVGDHISSSTWTSIAGNIEAEFPKGHDAFYCMKYEISQDQYADFINHLSLEEQKKVLTVAPTSSIGTNVLKIGVNNYFNSLIIKKSGNENLGFSAEVGCDLNNNFILNESKDGKELACNFLSWLQVMYYLDWVGMRPMTELEFEKAARGTQISIEREFAFGTPYVKDANTLLYDSTKYETYVLDLNDSTGIASHGYSGRQGPLRVGFGASETSNRLQAGASFWGIMELSGNLWEQTVSVSKSNGLNFKGSQGDGLLAKLPSDWLQEAMILRGGAWNSGISLTYRDLAVSDRYYYDLNNESARSTTGGRGVVSVKHLKL